MEFINKMKVYFKLEDIPKDVKIKPKNLSYAWIHIENLENLNYFYNLGYIYFDIIGKKDNINSFELCTKDFKRLEINFGEKYFDFLKEICEKFVYVQYSSDVGYFVEFIEEYYNTKNNLCVKIKIKVYTEDKKCRYFDISFLKTEYDLLNFVEDDIIPIKRNENTDKGNIVVDYVELNLNKNIYISRKDNKEYKFDLDFGIITDIKIEFNKFFNKNLTTIYYSYGKIENLKLSILEIEKFKYFKLKIGDTIYLKLTLKGFKTWDCEKQLFNYKSKLEFETNNKDKIDYTDLSYLN